MCIFTLRLFMSHISHGFTNGLISFLLLFQVSARIRLAVGPEFLLVRHSWFVSLLSFTSRRCHSKKVSLVWLVTYCPIGA
jgi:hypothetical protein